MLAASGEEALSVFSAHRFEIDLVITDMMMPGMDGLSTIEQLREIDGSVRLVAASGIHSNRDVVGAAGYGVANFLQKPYTAETLLKCLSGVLSTTPTIG